MQRGHLRMLRNLKKQAEGFTIIEVLIVLAIAGLILLIVFLAVPALQRNSRNTQRKNDVASILGAVSEYTNNNSGALPATSGTFNTEFTNANPKLGYYTTAANVQWTYQANAAAIPDPNNLDKVNVGNFAACNNNGTASQVIGATARGVVAVFDVEGSGGSVVQQCVGSGT